MEQGRSVQQERCDEPVGVLDSQTPYQLTLKGLLFPWRFQFGLNAFAGLSLALIGMPWLAAAWAVASCAADFCLQQLYHRWWRDAAGVDSVHGLRRLSWCAGLRSSLWLAGPTALALVTHAPAAYGYTALTALSMVALAVSCGWISRAVWAAIAVPAVLAVVIEVLPRTNPTHAISLLMGVASFAVTGILIALGTEKSLSEWSKANDRTRAVMARLKEALSRSEAAERRLRVGAETARLLLFEVDFEARTLFGEGAEADFFEQPLTFERFVEDPFSVVAPEDRDRVVAAWEAYKTGLAPYHVQFRVNRSDQEVWASARSEVTYGDDGRLIALVCALHNITDLKRSEAELIDGRDRAEAGSRAKSEFLATMSHEIRTPLNGVLGMAQAMTHDRLSRTQRTRLDVIRTSGERLLALLNSILDLSKIEAGRLELEDGVVDVPAVAQLVVNTFEALASEKGIALRLQVHPESEGAYAGDALRIEQILHNLVSNAVKFTERGSVDVTVSRIDERLHFAVADTGIGIDAEKQATLFEKFAQADSSVTRRFGGSGLGLAICQQLVALMGGDITLKSQPGRGSVFTVALALSRLEEAAPTAERALRVLAVDDNPTNQLVLRTLLQQVGIDPVTVSDGEQAVQAWSSGAWDLILMDIQMPVMDGVTATRRIREGEVRSGRPRTPILALTANVMVDQVEGYLSAGMDRVVAKPIIASALLSAISASLETQPASQEQAGSQPAVSARRPRNTATSRRATG